MHIVQRRLGPVGFLVAGILMVLMIAAAHAEETPKRTGYSGYPVPRFVALKKREANGRVGPGFDSPVAVVYRRKGLPLKVTAETSDNVWRRVEDHMGRRVWVHRSMLSENKHAIVAQPVVLFADPTQAALPRARLEPGVVARLETCDAEWCRLRTKDYRGWAERANLWGSPL